MRAVGRSGSSNRNHHTRKQVRENLWAAIAATAGNDAALNELGGIFLGMCGVSTDADRADIVSIVREIPQIPASVPIWVENDTRIGLTGGLSGRPGIVLIAGTGSACLGVTRDGASFLCGGWGALADDVGSAPWIGIRAIQAAVQAEDRRIAPTALRQRVFEFLGLAEPRALIDRVHNKGLEREEIGRLAPLVIQAYAEGDVAAAEILNDAAGRLSDMVAAVVRRLGPSEAWELILVGGLALSGPPFQPMLIQRITQETPRVRVVEPEMSPVMGAVLEAMRSAGVAMTQEILTNLRTTGAAAV